MNTNVCKVNQRSKIKLIDEWRIDTKKRTPIKVKNYLMRNIDDPGQPESLIIKPCYDDITGFHKFEYYMNHNKALTEIPSNNLDIPMGSFRKHADNKIPTDHYMVSLTTDQINDTRSRIINVKHAQYHDDALGLDPCIVTAYFSGDSEGVIWYCTKDNCLILDMNKKRGKLNIMYDGEAIIEQPFKFDTFDPYKLDTIQIEMKGYEKGGKEIIDGFYNHLFIYTTEGIVFSNAECMALRKVETKGDIVTVTNAVYVGVYEEE